MKFIVEIEADGTYGSPQYYAEAIQDVLGEEEVGTKVTPFEEPRFEVRADFANWVTDTVNYGTHDAFGVTLAVAQIMNDMRRWADEGQIRILTGIRVERVN